MKINLVANLKNNKNNQNNKFKIQISNGRKKIFNNKTNKIKFNQNNIFPHNLNNHKIVLSKVLIQAHHSSLLNHKNQQEK